MKRRTTVASLTVSAAIACAVAAYPLMARATLKPGDAAPAFVTQASLGGNVYQYSLADALKKGPVVLYFYPAAFTKGCTVEAHEFAEAVDQYKAQGATVIGVSHDDIGTLQRFSVSECRSKFPVAADTDAKIIGAYDAALPFKSSMANRVSYVIAPDGKVIYEYTSLSPDQHVANTLQALRDWNAKHKTQ
ncbi:Alkyl hydroperoxide reductase/ Thiol specific antioxidant/ Mal allergen [Burkholderia sp. 8Y]|uniref:peroxiredoxin n=1 Tax=Burkholderia sp. 8Y TaxID=2653133 RepID=UPI0012F347BC|nr:peroxiredoxin [Burkholderia sp. 8Y]VXC24570.1 Alkyl hydroperoxide reductase/ Thiol specific antioxidant/ Mal allergen [Burkholderia sp. 8Y]